MNSLRRPNLSEPPRLPSANVDVSRARPRDVLPRASLRPLERFPEVFFSLLFPASFTAHHLPRFSLSLRLPQPAAVPGFPAKLGLQPAAGSGCSCSNRLENGTASLRSHRILLGNSHPVQESLFRSFGRSAELRRMLPSRRENPGERRGTNQDGRLGQHVDVSRTRICFTDAAIA